MPKSTSPRLNRAVPWLLTIGLGYGAVQQGGFYPVQFQTVVLLVVLGGFFAAVAVRTRPPRWVGLILGALVALVLLAFISGVNHGVARKALPLSVICVALGGTIYATTAITPSARRLFAHTLLVVGLIVSFTSWWGVAGHRYPWAIPSQTLWRGASTLTYANAAAALLFAPMVLAAVMYLNTRKSAYLFVLYALAIGWGATLSRAAGTSLVIALIIVLVRAPDRRVTLRLWPLVPAAGVAVLALAPSLPEHDSAHPGIAIVGVLVGIAMLVTAIKVPARYCIAGLGVVAAISIGVITQSKEAHTALDRINSTRVGVQSDDRVDLVKVTWKQFRANPALGVGPQQIDFVYVNHAGELVQAQYTHNEYLQLATEIGAPAVLFLGVLLIGFVAGMRERTLEHVAGLAVLAAFGVHSALDFLWHVPEVTLVTVAVVCVLAGRESIPKADSL